MSSWPSELERTRIRASGHSFRRISMNCTPLIPGRRMSSTITSGRCSRQAASAAAPSATAETTLMSDCRLMTAANPSRTTGWSSTSATRMRRLGVFGSSNVPPSRPDRHRDFDLRTLALPAAQAHLAAEPLRPLAHSQQPETAAIPARRVFQIEAAAVDAHPQPHGPLFAGQLHGEVGGTAVPHRVGDGFLGDAEDLVRHLLGQRWGGSVHFAADARLRRDLADEGGQRGVQLLMLENARAQRPYRMVRLGNALQRQLVGAAQVASGRLLRCGRRGFELELDPDEALLEGIVKLVG